MPSPRLLQAVPPTLGSAVASSRHDQDGRQEFSIFIGFGSACQPANAEIQAARVAKARNVSALPSEEGGALGRMSAARSTICNESRIVGRAALIRRFAPPSPKGRRTRKQVWANLQRIVFLIALAVACSAQSALAQSTLFNIPTTDTVAKGKVYLEFDFQAQLPKPAGADRQYTIDPRVVAGPGGNVEIGANVEGFRTPPITSTRLEPNIKWKFVHDNNNGLAAAAGSILYVPLNHRDTMNTFALVYGNFSKKLNPGNNGPRFTAGTYGVVTNGTWVGPKAGALVGYEQPIQSKITFVADWFSGKNFFGYFTPGFSIKLPANSVFNAGYSLGNNSYHGNDNRFLFLYYGITF
jgi:hypothetical protein